MQLHDEDGDGVGDECDPCPHIAGDNLDSDNDSVGDACDPNPTIPGEKIRVLVTFEDGSPIGWTDTQRGTTGILTYADDAARFALDNGDVSFLTIPEPQASTLLVDARFNIEAKSPNAPGNTARNFAIIEDYDLVTDSGLMYGPVYDYTAPDILNLFVLSVLNSQGNGVLGETAVSTDFAYDMPYLLRFVRRDAERETVLQSSEAKFTATAQVASRPAGVIGLRTRGLTGTVDYIVVIY